MFKDTIQALKNKDNFLLLSAVSLEEDVNQMMYLVLRTIRSAIQNPTLSNQLEIDPMSCLEYQTLVYSIERVGDHVTNVAGSLLALYETRVNVPERVTETLIKAAEIAINSYNLAINSFQHMDVEQINSIIDDQNKIRELCSEITPIPINGDVNEILALTHIETIRENIMMISNLSADIAELTIDRTFKKIK